MANLSLLPTILINMQLFGFGWGCGVCDGGSVILWELAVEGCQTLSHLFLIILIFNLYILCNSLEEHRM